MLEATLQSDFRPGTNLRGDIAGATWALLLPQLDPERIVCLGPPGEASLARLAQLGREVIVACRTSRQSAALGTQDGSDVLQRVRAALCPDYSRLDLPAESVDVLVLADPAAICRAADDREFVSRLREWLKRDGVVYCELAGRRALSTCRRLGGRFVDSGMPQTSLWLTPLSGEVQTAVVHEDQEATAFLLARRAIGRPMTSTPIRDRWRRLAVKGWLGVRRRAEAWVHAQASRRSRYGRHALLAGAGADLSQGPPRYICDLAREAGLDLRGYRWALTALGQFSTRKVLWYLFDDSTSSAAAPSLIVKMTRTPAHNMRLERERDALIRLAGVPFGDGESLPRVAFAGHHAGAAIVGETALPGAPFENETDFSPRCPRVRAALAWFTGLGEATADHQVANPARIADTLEELLLRFADIYPLTQSQLSFLARQFDMIGRSSDLLPLVFQHGDAGCWNLLVTPSGGVGVLDWESGETGLPLWDVFYLFRSLVSRADRRAAFFRRRGRPLQRFLNDAGYGELLEATVRRYCERVGLTADLVEPLFYTCWMHRALKESTRLTPERLPTGASYRWLTGCMNGRDAPTLRRIFTPKTTARSPAPAIAMEGPCS